MTPEQQRTAIAEACGWELVGTLRGYPPYANKNRSLAFPPHTIPDYINDLNAMHEAEKSLTTTDHQNAYYANIAEIAWGCEETRDRQVVFNQLTSTAAHRAEAFLRTIGKWKDSE
jgi:hypothetical protein